MRLYLSSFRNGNKPEELLRLLGTGRRTYEIMTAQDEFVEGPEYIVATRNPELSTGNLRKIVIQSMGDMPKANKWD